MTATEVITNNLPRFGIGLNVEELVTKIYVLLILRGYEPCIVNDRYIECDGINYQFIKSRANGCWKVKEF